MASTYLDRTPGSAGNRKTWTLSGWYKRSARAADYFLSAGQWAVSQLSQIIFEGDDYLNVAFYSSGSVLEGHLETNRKFRDPTAWYHIVIAMDTTQSVAADRLKIYVNGVQETSFKTETYPAEDYEPSINNNVAQNIGRREGSGFFNGLMAHVHFIDGLAYAPTVFGETDATSGIWIAKTSPSVTYGTNGYFLKFQDAAAYGDDSSGNTNDFSVGAGTMTQTKDTPDNNFCTMNPLNNYLFNGTYSNGNNTVATDVKCWNSTTLGMTTGKWYWETKIASSTSGSDWTVGFAGITATGASDDGGSTEGTDVFHYRATGAVWNNGSTSLTTTSYTSGDIISIALDLTNNKWYVGKNGTWLNSGDPTSGATGTGAVGTTTASGSTTAGAYFPSVSYLDASQSGTFNTNFGNGYFGTTIVSSSESDDAGIGSFEYDVPAGYYALCTTNLGDQS